ncbi:MAG: hypothetical protein JRH06_02920 [Deltaproteobacteria bacterium]|nr:hypothetical protein [Deltaproteobacteria bacterium]MBW2136490.1 hypothetical protein [Deltaproteobacteria bacterium]
MVEKDCYGILDRVFPMGMEGLREVSKECLQCPHKTPCLRTALSTKEGLEMRSQRLEQMTEGGFLGRLKRWSRKKELSRLMKERE